MAKLHHLAALVVMSTGIARAEPDNRPQDRFFFGLHSGIANRAELTDTPSLSDPASAFALEHSYWGNDYVGFGWGWDLQMINGAETTAIGAHVVGAVPLRYVQPYAGGWLGFRYRKLMPGVGETDLLFHPVVGVNGYINRNTRLFAQLQAVDIDADTDETAQVITLGVRWSPDVFHRLRGADKFNTLWLTSLTTVGAFFLARWAMRSGGEEMMP